MTRRSRALAVASAAQLGCGLVGVATALRRGHAYDLPLLHGRPDRIGRDAILIGTALSGPLPMMGAQALATRHVLHGERDGARKLLGVLGIVITTGYLGERHVRQRLRRSGYDQLETPLIAIGIATAVAMAALSTAD